MYKRISVASILVLSLAASGAALAQTPASPAAAKPAAAKVASAARAASAPKAAKVAKTAAVKVPKGKLLIDNHRETALTELTLQPAGAKAGTEPTVVAKSLAAGQKITIALPAKSGCVFNINGSFEDESTLDVPASDLCKDPVITLVE